MAFIMKKVMIFIMALLYLSCTKKKPDNLLGLFSSSNTQEKLLLLFKQYEFANEPATKYNNGPISWYIINGDTSLSYLTNFEKTKVTYGSLIISNPDTNSILNNLNKIKGEGCKTFLFSDSSLVYYYNSDSSLIKYYLTREKFKGEFIGD